MNHSDMKKVRDAFEEYNERELSDGSVLFFDDVLDILDRELAAPEQEPDPSVYNLKRIGWELERTAMGDGYYGNALYAAKEIPGLTSKDRSLLDRYMTGGEMKTDHVALQDLAMRIYKMEPPAPQSAQPKPYAVAKVDDLERGGRVRAKFLGLSLDAPLYTEPPSREWQGLTEDEIAAVLGFGEHTTESTKFLLANFARAIEDALRAKNSEEQA